ncbi:MAG: reverse transcriptase family protein, partial [Mycoplasmataceae bacterium]|nr:reverse transcriptase family protein [Mycoplasmataceae bacterium]
GFNNFFTNVGPQLANKIPNDGKNFKDYLKNPATTKFKFKKVNSGEVIKIISTLKSKDSCGVDGLSTRLLKTVAPNIIDTLTHLINLSLETGYIPNELKIAKIIPIYKSGEKNVYTNYRPISLLPAISKLFEKVAATQLNNYLNTSDLFYLHQYAFRDAHNTMHPLIHFIDKIYKSFTEKVPKAVLSIFLDLKKAFDTVNHDILLKKLEYYGIQGCENTWFQNYLSGRTQFVDINGVASNPLDISCGVPQGSILGPILFLIYINDLPNVVEFLTLLFADDTTFQYTHSDIKTLFEQTNTQLALASEWFSANKLTLHAQKTKYMVFLPTGGKTDDLNNYKIKLGDTILERVGTGCKDNSIKFVGLYIDDKLRWDDQLKNVRKKLNCANFHLARSKNLLPLSARKTIYNSIFRPHLDYGLLAWGGVNKTKIKPIVTLQKKAIRNLANAHYIAHTEPIFKQYKLLKLDDLYQLQVGKFIHSYMTNITKDKLPKSFTNFFTLADTMTERNTRQSKTLNLHYKTSKKDKIDMLTTPQIIKTWNAIPLELKMLPSKGAFKKQFIIKKVDSYENI